MQLAKRAERGAPMDPLQAKRRRGVRRTTFVVTGVVLFFYFGFIIMMLFRAYRATH
jgi:hypothetical protein